MLSLSVLVPFLLCCPSNIPHEIALIIQKSLAIIVWCISLSLDNNVYKMRENFFLHEIIESDSMLAVIILSTIYLIYSIIINIVRFCVIKEFCKNNKYKTIIPLFFIFECYLAIFTLSILPKNNHYKNDYLQTVYNKSCQKYRFCPTVTDINELENLQSVNKAFLAFIIIIFILTFIKCISTFCAKCKNDEYKYSFLIPSSMQSIFIIINFGLIITIASKVYKKGRTDVFNIVTYKLKRKILIILINIICYIILFILEFILIPLDHEKNSDRIIPYSSHVPTYSSSTLTVRVPQNIPKGVIPKEIEEIIKDLEEKINDFIKTFIEEENKVKDKLSKFLGERRSKINEFIKKSETEKNDEKNKEELEKLFKDLNEVEYDCEVDILLNEVNKIHYIFKLGLDSVQKCKDIIIEDLNQKMAATPVKSVIDSKIKKITDYKPEEFLDSTFGKPLKSALEKYGFSRPFINSLKKNLINKRNKRRESERNEFSLENNTFEDDKNNFEEVDLYKFITEEYQDEDFIKKLKKEILNKI